MAHFFIAQYEVKNPALYAEYQGGAGPTLAQYGGELVAFDIAAETMEGSSPGPQTVIIKFADADAAKKWYNSPEYQAVVGKRLEATSGYAVLSADMNAGG